jgi:hypothetical protein
MTDAGANGSERLPETSKRRPLDQISIPVLKLSGKIRVLTFLAVMLLGMVRELDRIASGAPYNGMHAAILAVLFVCSAGLVANLMRRTTAR